MSQARDYLDMLAGSLTARTETAPVFTVADLVKAQTGLDLEVVAGQQGLHRRLAKPKVQLLGLALAGYTDDLEVGAAQVLAGAELRFIQEHLSDQAAAFFSPEFRCDLPCFLVPENLTVPDAFAAKADDLEIPVLRTAATRLDLENAVVRLLERELAPRTSIHGVMVVVSGLGVLILGKSGIGKSDCALDLITHGHQLVADDVVTIRSNTLGQLIGKAKGAGRHHMDIRGLGIINVKEMFSLSSVLDEHEIDMVIYLQPWDDDQNRSGRPEEEITILDLPRPLYRLPISRGRNWINLIEVAVRKYSLQHEGYDAEAQLKETVSAMLRPQEST